MAEREQSYQNHARLFPLFHYIALPILAGNFFYGLYAIWARPGAATVWGAIVAFALVALAFSARAMALTVQDRVIRLEMQMRMARLLPADLLARTGSIERGQLVALRFASDAELPDLVREVVEGRLSLPKDIKQRVRNWQADWLRA